MLMLNYLTSCYVNIDGGVSIMNCVAQCVYGIIIVVFSRFVSFVLLVLFLIIGSIDFFDDYWLKVILLKT